MKKILVVAIFIMLAFGLVYWYEYKYQSGSKATVIHEITLGGYKLNVEFARTLAEQQQGLMYRTVLAPDAGMLFLFTHDGQKTFWNKNTYIPLDIIWLHEDQVVGTSQLPAITEGLTTVVSPSNTNRVLEVNRGWVEQHGIQIGARMW